MIIDSKKEYQVTKLDGSKVIMQGDRLQNYLNVMRNVANVTYFDSEAEFFEPVENQETENIKKPKKTKSKKNKKL